MRFVWAVAAFVLAALMIGAGIAQRTVFQGPDSVSETVETDGATAFTVVDGDVLNLLPGTQTLTAAGDGTVFAAYGRDDDVRAWLADTTWTELYVDDEGQVATRTVEPTVEPEVTPAEEAAAPAEDGAAVPEETPVDEVLGRSPVGSDLWLDEFQGDDRLTTPLRLPDTMSVLIASDGTAAAPAELTVSWPIARSTPWSGPLIVGGGILILVGLFLYILGIRHARRSRGPRRKGLPIPQTEPIDLTVEGGRKGVISAGRIRRALGSGRRGFIVVPFLAVGALVFAGCSAESWPQLGGSPTPSPTETVIVPEGQKPPAVTDVQAERILERVSATVAEADAAADGTLAATRLTGAALAERQTNYTLRGTLPEEPALTAIPAGPASIVLPQTTDTWPRTFLAVVEEDASDVVRSSMIMLTQADAWSEYKVQFLGNLEPSTEVPQVAASYVGSTQVQPDSPFLVLPPEQLAAAYADVVDNGENSASFGLFDAASDQFRVAVAQKRQDSLTKFNETGASTGTMEFSTAAGPHAPLALATLDTGAIVAVSLNEVETVTPTNEDAVIRFADTPRVAALTGVEQSTTGVTTTYGDQVFFYVPGQGSNEKIRFLGYASNILEAKVIE